ncbi:MAG TPA: hypothetical protein VIM06_02645 [Rhodanobacter sp.]
MRGFIGYFGLESWWQTVLTENEREQICKRFGMVGSPSDGRYLLEDEPLTFCGGSAPKLVAGMASLFSKDGERQFAYKLLEKSEALISDQTPILDIHFVLHDKIKICYRDSNTPEGLAQCKFACRQQIEIADRAAEAFRDEFDGPLVEHWGFQRLAMIHEHQGEYEECIRVCAEAMAQGWTGDWTERSARCHLRMEKAALRAKSNK